MRKGGKSLFKLMEKEGVREIRFHFNPKTKLKAILAIDFIPNKRDEKGKLKDISVDGGTRFSHKTEEDALKDAVRLARAMTRKTNVLNAKEGGAKAVVLSTNKKTKKFLESIGDFIQIQGGFFKTAIDLGFNLNDAHIIHTKTDYIDSLDSHLDNGLGSTGETTAQGIASSLKIVSKKFLKKELKLCTIAIQGLGAVGMNLAFKLKKIGCVVIASDIKKELCNTAKKKGIIIVNPNKILYQKVDILSPCAFGGIINKNTIKKLRCKIVAGGANNQLENELKDEKRLLKRKIIFIPDFILNSGGFLQALVERKGGNLNEAAKETKIISLQLVKTINYAKKNNCTLLEAAIKLFDKK
jgi:leucine dehydrogenase